MGAQHLTMEPELPLGWPRDRPPPALRPVKLLYQTAASDVYLAYDRRERRVVVKILRLVGEEERRLFIQANDLLAGIEHPNIVPLLATGELPDGRSWVAMPYLEGGSLETRLKPATALPPDAVLRIGVRMAEVLDELHRESGVVHRDVKPGNILLAGDNEPVLADVHVSGPLRDDTRSLTTNLMTLHYAAKEVREHHRYSVRSEVYSLGLTLRELWAALPRPPSRELDGLFTRALSDDPAGRPESMAALAAGLRAAEHEMGYPLTSPTPTFAQGRRERSGGPATVHHRSRPTRGPRTGASRRGFLGIVGLAGIAGTVGLTLPVLLADDQPGGDRPVGQASVGLEQPWGIAIDHTGSSLLVADTWNLAVRRRRLDSTEVDVVAGAASNDGRRAAGDAGAIEFGYPCGLAFRRDGSFYVADSVMHTVWLVHRDGSPRRIARKSDRNRRGAQRGRVLLRTAQQPRHANRTGRHSGGRTRLVRILRRGRRCRRTPGSSPPPPRASGSPCRRPSRRPARS
jgi:hypothetical protein